MSAERRLAAIMFTDIVGYTTLMSQSEQKAFELLSKNRQLQRPVIEEFDGRWIKELGDGVLASFQTVSDAVNAAVRIQNECNAVHDFQLRIGIHLGEVVFESGDVFGDGVNVASRIEAMGIPGSVLISKSVRDQIKNNPDFPLVSLGAFDFKNVPESLEIFALANPGLIVPKKEDIRPVSGGRRKRPVIYKWLLALLLVAVAVFATWFFTGQEISPDTIPDKSIAVLPFVNRSGDADQEYFSDGLSEELINVLAKTPQLKVIGRTSSFAFKGKNEDLREIGQMLGVSYLVEGSVRKSGNTLRITAQLINAADGSHLYSERFDRKLEDVFAIQDAISLAILDAVKIELFGAEKQNVLKRYTDNVEVYQLYLNGQFHYNQYSPEAFKKAIDFFEQAIALDSSYAIAYSAMSFCYLNLWTFNWLPPEECLPQGLMAAERALQLDSTIAESHLAVGRVKLHYEWKIDEAFAEYKKAVAINPNSAEIHVQLGFCASLLGKRDEAMEHVKIAESLDPFSLLNLSYLSVIPWTTGDYDKQLELLGKIIDMAPNFSFGHEALGDHYVMLGEYEKAIAEYELDVKLNYGTPALGLLGMTYGLMGENQKARDVLEEMNKIAPSQPGTNNFAFGLVHAALGEFDIAFQYFDQAVQNHENLMIWIAQYFKRMPEFQKDPRTNELLNTIGVKL